MRDIVKYLESKGLEIVRDDGTELACYCPFHNNRDTPAFYVNKSTGLWICFNPSCAKRGSLRDLMVFYGDTKPIVRDYSLDDIESILNYTPSKEDDGWEEVLDRIRLTFDGDEHKAQYLIDRGFELATLRRFEIGFSEKKNRLVIPVRDERHHAVGFIGRALDPNAVPKYMYSKGFPRKSVLFNLNNAKEFDIAVVVEGSLDAMKIHQAGFPNVVSTLGAAVTEEHFALLKKNFSGIIIFSDNDHAGYAMRDLIIEHCYDLDLKIVQFEDPQIKDPGEMTKDQIAHHIESALDYFTWSFDNVF